jgi:hypothetical protein
MRSIRQMTEAKPLTDGKDFSSLAEALSAAAYVEQILAAENNLIVNRLSWLFVSQSFCISAYVVLETSVAAQQAVSPHLGALRFAVPILGIICCLLVGLAIWASSFESYRLADERARLCKYLTNTAPHRSRILEQRRHGVTIVGRNTAAVYRIAFCHWFSRRLG